MVVGETKPAELETRVAAKVPLFVSEGGGKLVSRTKSRSFLAHGQIFQLQVFCGSHHSGTRTASVCLNTVGESEMPVLLMRVGFVGREAIEVRDAARQQRFNSGELELRGTGGERKVYVSGQPASFGHHAVAFIKDKFFSLVHVKRFATGDQKTAALISFRDQVKELNVTQPRLKEKYLHELEFKLLHGLPLRASYHSKAIQELFSVIDADAGNRAEGGRIVPPEYNAVVAEPQQREGNTGIPDYAEVAQDPQPHLGDIDPDIQIRPVPHYFERGCQPPEDPLDGTDEPIDEYPADRGLFGSPNAAPLASTDEAPAYDNATGHAQHAMDIQGRVYGETQNNHAWKDLRHLHRPPERLASRENYSGAFGEHASRFDQVAGNTEDFYQHYLKPALEEAGSLPQFRSEDEQKNFAGKCLKLHKDNYMDMVAQKFQNQESQQGTLGYRGIREFLEVAVCSATLAGKGEPAAMRQKVFQPQMAQMPDLAEGVVEQNHAIAGRLRDKFGLTGKKQVYERACGLAAASNAYVLMAHRQDTKANSQWFSKNPPEFENFVTAADEVIGFSEAASQANGKAINESDVEMKIFKTLCEQSWKNYSGPGENQAFIAETPSEIMVDMGLRQAWKECSCLGRQPATTENQPVINYLNLFGKDQGHNYSKTFTSLYRNALADKVRNVDAGNKNYELECLLGASDLLMEIEKEVAGLSLRAPDSPPRLDSVKRNFLTDMYEPLCLEIGGNPAEGIEPDQSGLAYTVNLSDKLEVLGAYEMDVAAKDPGLVGDVQNLPVTLSKIYEKVLAKMILHDLGRDEEANDDAYLEGVCNRACGLSRNNAMRRVSDANNQERESALEVLGITTNGIKANPNGGTEALLYLQHLSKQVIRLQLRNQDLEDGGRGVVDEKMLSNLDILQLEGSDTYIENAINHWTAKKTVVGKKVTAAELQMQVFTKINELCWWHCRREMYDRTQAEGFSRRGLSGETRDMALQGAVQSDKEFARFGTDAILARGPYSFFTHAVTEKPFSEHQKAYGKLRSTHANQIRKAWREGMNIAPEADDIPAAFQTTEENLGFLLKGRVVLRDLLDRGLAQQA